MKVIMLKDVPKVGKIHEVKEFSNGYANNVLIAKGLAEKATPHGLMKLEAMKTSQKKKKEEEHKHFVALLDKLNSSGITLNAPSNEKGILFKAINAKDINNEIFKLTGERLKEENLLVGIIKEVGGHKIKVKGDSGDGELRINVK